MRRKLIDKDAVRRAGKLANSTRLLIKEMKADTTSDERRRFIWGELEDNALDGCTIAMIYGATAPHR